MEELFYFIISILIFVNLYFLLLSYLEIKEKQRIIKEQTKRFIIIQETYYNNKKKLKELEDRLKNE